MWYYSQATGELKNDNGKLVATGYSGLGPSFNDGRNNPDMETIKGAGPIPRGLWKIGTFSYSDNVGPVSAHLSPINHDAHGRTAFMIHGNNQTNNASHGCVILDRPTREKIRDSGDDSLMVMG